MWENVDWWFLSTNETNPGHFAWVGEKFDTLKKKDIIRSFLFPKYTHNIWVLPRVGIDCW